jgi:hypothetical protein
MKKLQHASSIPRISPLFAILPSTHGSAPTFQLNPDDPQEQILDPQTPRLPGPACVFSSSSEKDYDVMLENQMLHGQWIFVGYGCRTLQWMLRHETSQTFVFALWVRVLVRRVVGVG